MTSFSIHHVITKLLITLLTKQVSPLSLLIKFTSHILICLIDPLNLAPSGPYFDLQCPDLLNQQFLVLQPAPVSLHGLTRTQLLLIPAELSLVFPETETCLEGGPGERGVFEGVLRVLNDGVFEFGKLREGRVQISYEFRVVED